VAPGDQVVARVHDGKIRARVERTESLDEEVSQ
jgi:hypothetical protein